MCPTTADNGARRRFVVKYALLYTAFMMLWLVVIRLVLIRLGEVTSSTQHTIGVFIGQAAAMFAFGWWLAGRQWRQRTRRGSAHEAA
jgi:hypothetical protein